ncbi:MAG: hypothetical protein AAFY28_06165 [Actinomycetota bacterium]
MIRGVAAALLAALISAGCATTFEEGTDSTDTPDVVATTAVAVPENTADALAAIASNAQRLTTEIGDEGDEDATLAEIEVIYANVESTLIAENESFAEGYAAAIELARTAVARNRPGDANKAAQLLSNLAADYAS